MKKPAMVLSLLLAAMLTFYGCSSANLSGVNSILSTETDNTGITEPPATADASDMFTNNDMEIGYDEETSTKIVLSGDGASSDSDSVKISGSTVTITDEGTYILSGVLNDGMIAVDAEDTDKIRLILNSVQIKNSDSAAIYVSKADKVFVTTASGSENSLINGGEYVAIDDNNIDAVIFSKSDLTLNGSGELTVNAVAGHGIVSKDDLVFTGGTYDITSEGHGITGKDSIRIANGTYTVTSGKDGIHSENTDDTDKGFTYIGGGTFTIKADGDGISADAYLQIEHGDFKITTGGGSSNVNMPSDGMGFGQNRGFTTENTTSQTDGSVSLKGVKTDGALTITGGNFTTDTEDDSFHAGGDILVADGVFNIKSGDDGVHSDTNVKIQNGDFTIPYCYEGIEGETVTIDDGIFDITSVDDGINSAGGADSSGFSGGRPGQDQFSSSSASSIIINGGTLSIVSNGDCVDSNGALTVNGGKLNLTCNGNGNTALDCDGTYNNNGGDITTNDGSENNPGQMGGGSRGAGQHRDKFLAP